MEVKLVMFKSDGTRKDFTLLKERTVLGRTGTADLRIPLSSVSRQHCEVTIAPGQVKLRDLGSSNGTFRNGVRIQEATLSAGDEVMVGPVTFTLTIDGQPTQLKPVRTLVGARREEPTQPVKLDSHDHALPLEVDEEPYTPTVDLDDPLAALQKASEAAHRPNSPRPDDEDLPLLADDDEDIPLLAEDDPAREDRKKK